MAADCTSTLPPPSCRICFSAWGRAATTTALMPVVTGLTWLTRGVTPDTVLRIHDAAYRIHRTLWQEYDYHTDIIFDRPNYCKIDLMNQNSRSQSLFLSGNEVEMVQTDLTAHGLQGGISDLLELAAGVGKQVGLSLKVTCDAKYLEVGVLNKSDNVDAPPTQRDTASGYSARRVCLLGGRVTWNWQRLNGSDSFMHTILSSPGDFFDVGTVPGIRPQWVRYLGGSIHTFLSFLREQAAL